MEKSLKAVVGEKEYVLEFTRASIRKAEETFGVSMLKREEPKTVKELTDFLNALLYGALIKHHPGVKPEQIDSLYEDFTGEDGYEQEGLVEALVELLANVLNPTGGGRKKKLLKK